ncbi:acetate/propionate family kinase [Fluviispira multicolorata]|uniref:Acetate kinase n=1 Tax=Fluviispira multicolorata TaxID=2654512 RepID=A0A833JCJ3_9BACT|nr:acetate kinase [Fluviispira multicolorata]KAB8029712.1 acetate/propionate family kinase [Fluviispira multicolorata]
MNILVINSGSSSLKFQIIETDQALIDVSQDKVKVKGLIDRIGTQSVAKISVTNGIEIKEAIAIRDHSAALDYIFRKITSGTLNIEGISSIADIKAVGHRVVHGGEKFSNSVLVDKSVLKEIEECIDLAPLHNPANLKGIQATLSLFGEKVPHVVVFDTAFHSTIPEVNYLYALPYQYYRRYRIRKYGFHGMSHRYVSYRYRKLVNLERDKLNIIVVHLGNGCSACAIKDGKSFDTSMGFTPLAGLVMGTRAGDIDASIMDFLAHKEGVTLSDIDILLNKASGLLGVSGLTNDMRELLDEEKEHHDRRATLAINMFTMRIKHYIGAYLTEMGGADAILFTGGIGENSAEIRKRICENMKFLGLEIDDALNKQKCFGAEGEISTPSSKLKAWVIPTNEELMIARDTFRCVAKVPST